MSITAAAIRKKLKPRNRQVERRRAAGGGEALLLYGEERHAECCGVDFVLESVRYIPAAEAASPSAGIRSRLIVPQRLGHKRLAVASETNALGVVRYSSQ